MACPECKSERCGTMNETHSEADAWHQEALCQGRQATGAIAARDAYREALRALVEAQVRCEERGCDALATFVADDAAMMSVPYCEDHGYDHDGDEYARRLALKTAAPLRAALALLKGPA